MQKLPLVSHKSIDLLKLFTIKINLKAAIHCLNYIWIFFPSLPFKKHLNILMILILWILMLWLVRSLPLYLSQYLQSRILNMEISMSTWKIFFFSLPLHAPVSLWNIIQMLYSIILKSNFNMSFVLGLLHLTVQFNDI